MRGHCFDAEHRLELVLSCRRRVQAIIAPLARMDRPFGTVVATGPDEMLRLREASAAGLLLLRWVTQRSRGVVQPLDQVPEQNAHGLSTANPR